MPILVYEVPDTAELDAALRDAIVRRMQRDPGVVLTNRGGWHSRSDLHEWGEPSTDRLCRLILDLVPPMVQRLVAEPDRRHLDGWVLEAWANVSPPGARNVPHNHVGRSQLSGFYCVDPGGPAAGRTRFQDRSGVPKETLRDPDPFGRELALEPRPGLLALFPASLYHAVEPHRGGALRITVAFNLAHPGFCIPTYEQPATESFWWRNLRGPMLALDGVRRASDALRALPGRVRTAGLRQGWRLASQEAHGAAVDRRFGSYTPGQT